ncbi:MAG: OmpA family protein, partial [Devosia sp.]|nr:OmpA family protein [Devosia sp.]
DAAVLLFAQAGLGQAQSSGSITVLAPPRISDYWVSATRQPGGAIIFDGYVPDPVIRNTLAAHPGADVQWLQLGSGAPTSYQAAVDFGLSILDGLSEGRFAVRDNIVTLSGTAASAAEYIALNQTVSRDLPAGVVLARSEILPPRASPYQWSAAKSSNNALTLNGMVPDPAAEQTLLNASGSGVTASLTYASGNPENFLSSARLGLSLLQRLDEGQLVFNGAGWIFTGTAASLSDKTALEAEFSSRKLAAAGWSMAIAEPRSAPSRPAAPLPPAAPRPTTAQPAGETNQAKATATVPGPATAAPAKISQSTSPAGQLACVAPLAEFSARNAILFRSGAAIIAPESAPALDELATDLAACPDAIVHVEGHTDTDGNDQSNLALSVARAEAVVAALVERGIAPARLYALGYGETSPIGDNDTAEGKRLNRRIVITVPQT